MILLFISIIHTHMKIKIISALSITIILLYLCSCGSYFEWYNKTNKYAYTNFSYTSIENENIQLKEKNEIQNNIKVELYEKSSYNPSISSYHDRPKYIMAKPLKYKDEIYEVYEYEELDQKNSYNPSISSYHDKPKYIIAKPLKYKDEIYEVYEY